MYKNLKEFCKENWFTLKDRIDYKWDRYDNLIVSVTSILKIIVDPWFEFVVRNYWDKLQEACDNGTRIHSMWEEFYTPNYLKQCDSDPSQINLQWSLEEISEDEYLKSNKDISMIVKFHCLYNTENIALEKRYEREWVSWCIDLICKLNYKWRRLIKNVDWKTSKKHSPKYLVQLWWYKWLNWNDWLIVYIKDKLVIKEVDPKYEKIFIEAKDLFFELLNKR
jgi:hypothetical protein